MPCSIPRGVPSVSALDTDAFAWLIVLIRWVWGVQREEQGRVPLSLGKRDVLPGAAGR